MKNELKLGLNLGYWGSMAPGMAHVELAKEAEKLGFDSVWTAESWGNDAFTPLAWIGANTSKIRLGTAVAQISARTPTACAMSVLAMDHLSNGRMVLGLGASGPQVVEGWYGQPYAKPVTRTREYVEIIRKVLRRDEPVTYDGEFYKLPYKGANSWDMGKPLKAITHPLRKHVPIFLGAEGPKNIEQTIEIADGWLPLYYSPYRPEVYAEHLKNMKPGFEITAMAMVHLCDNVDEGLYMVQAMLGFYIGGMGSKQRNFHKELMSRFGYEAEANHIQELFMAGKKDEAIAAVPKQFADEISLVGPRDRIKEKIQDWKKSPVTTLNMMGDLSLMRMMAEIAL